MLFTNNDIREYIGCLDDEYEVIQITNTRDRLIFTILYNDYQEFITLREKIPYVEINDRIKQEIKLRWPWLGENNG